MGTSARGAPTPRHPVGVVSDVVTSWNTRNMAVSLEADDITALGGCLIPLPPDVFGKTLFADGIGGAFWGTLPTTGGGGSGVSSFGSPHRTGAVVLVAKDITDLGGALVPPGGIAGKVLAKIDGTDFNTAWSSAIIPAGGSTGQVLVKQSGTNYDVGWAAGGGGGAGVDSFNGRTGPVSLLVGDILPLGGLVPLPTPNPPFGKTLTTDGAGGYFWG